MRLNTSGWQRGLERLAQRFPQATARALNRAIASASVVMVREVAADMGLKQGDVKRYITTRLAPLAAAADQLSAAVVASSARIPLIRFSARGPEPSRGRGRGVTARLPTGPGRYPQAFIATMASGHRGVFVRAGASSRRSAGARSANLPVTELHGPSVPLVFGKHLPAGLARGEEQLRKNLVHELRFALQQSAG